MPASIEGALITTRAGAFEIAEACAGLRFLIAAVMLAAIFSYVSFATWRKRAAFLTAAVAFALIANGLRVFALIFVATATDKRWAVGPDHLLVGWGFYAALFAILIAVGRRYADPMAPARLRGPMNHAHIAGAIPAIAIIGALSLYADIVIDRRAAPNAPADVSLISAPGWRILAPPQNWRAEIKSADYNASATYVSGGAAVYVSFGAFTHDRRGAEIVTEDNRAFDGNYWRKIAARRDAIYLFGLSRQTEFALLAGPQGRRLAAVNAYWLDGEIYNDPRRVKLAQMKARLLGRNPPGGMIVFASAYAQDPAEAIAAIRRFTTDLEPLDAWLARMSAH
jgi:EpsI family protein